MSITRWDPWADMISLRDAMNDLFQQSFVRPQGGSGTQVGTIPVDVREKGNDYIIHASMPGVNPKNIDVSVLGDTVRIRGEYNESESFPEGQQGQGQQGQQTQTQGQSQGQTQPQGQQGQGQMQGQGQQGQMQSQQGQMQMQGQQGQQGRWLMRERRFGAFERIVRLPTDVNASQAKADYNNGVLTLTLPKAEHARERRIPVGAGAGGEQPQEIEVEAGKSGKQSRGQQGQQGQQAQPVH